MKRVRKNGKLRKRVNELRRKLHPVFPVYVRQVHGLRCRKRDPALAETVLHLEGKDGPYFQIRLDAAQSWDSMWESLIHEFAHCLSWNHDDHPDLDHHDAAWGVAYAKVFNALDP